MQQEEEELEFQAYNLLIKPEYSGPNTYWKQQAACRLETLYATTIPTSLQSKRVGTTRQEWQEH